MLDKAINRKGEAIQNFCWVPRGLFIKSRPWAVVEIRRKALFPAGGIPVKARRVRDYIRIEVAVVGAVKNVENGGKR